MAEILIMEPEIHLGTRMKDILSHAGHACTLSQTIDQGLAQVAASPRLLTLLNARLPWKESFTFLKTLDEKGWPLLFMTGDAANAEHLRAMYHSPCNVLLSPFDGPRLISAVAELTRSTGDLLTLGGLQLDLQNRQVKKNGQELNLTAQEFALLHALMQSPDAAVSREELLRTAWGYQTIGETRTVDVHIQRLRRKIGHASIETVYKLGYRLRPA